MSIEQILVNLAKSALKSAARYLIDQGRDPKAELNAMFDLADVIADAAEDAKFGGG